MQNFYKNFFSESKTIVYLILLSFLTILISNYVFNYEESLSKQDASGYILMAQDLNYYLNLNHQDAVRLLPSLFVFIFSKIFSVSIFYSFKILVYFFFIMLILKTYFFFQKFNFSNYLCFSSVLILYFSNHSVIYTVFNIYQLLDLLLYFFSIIIIESAIFNYRKRLLFFSILAVFTKEFLFVLVLCSYLYNFIRYKNLIILLDFILVFSTFILNLKVAGMNFAQPESQKISGLIINYFTSYKKYLFSAYNSLILNLNFFLFLPFVLLFLDKKYLNFLKNYFIFFIYGVVPISFSVFLYDLAGNNFFRVFYQGYFIIVLFGLIYILKSIKGNGILTNIYFLSPLFFSIDFFYIIFNIHQDGFYKYYQVTRYLYPSGYYFFLCSFLIIISYLFKKK